MKCAVYAVLFMLSVVGVFAQDTPIMTVSPEKPRAGSTVTVKYYPDAPGAVLQKASAIDVEMMMFRDASQPRVVSARMEREGATWSASLTIDEPTAQLLTFRFITSDGTADDNGGNVWDVPVYGATGKPVQGAHVARGELLRSGGWGYMQHKRDAAAASKEYQNELELYPGNLKAKLLEIDAAYGMKKSESAKSAALSSLADIATKACQDEKLVGTVIKMYKTFGDTVRSAKLKSEELERRPHGAIADGVRMDEVYGEKDPDKCAALVRAVINDVATLTVSAKAGLLRSAANSYIRANRYDDGIAFMEAMEIREGSMYNQIAWGLIEKKEMLEKATAWAKKGVELARHPDPALRQPYISEASQRANDEYQLGAVLDTYGAGLLLTERYAEAEGVMKEACTTMKNEDPDANGRYVRAMLRNKNYSGAQTFGFECIKAGKTNDTLMADVREAFLSDPTKTSTDLEKAVADARADLMEKVRKEVVASRVHLPSKDFTVSDLDGNPVTLSSYRGKVVIVDYWATWCGPCKLSFPLLQKVYLKFKDNPRVAFLAINTWDKRDSSFSIKSANAKKFMTDHSYGIPTFIDQGSAELYDVEGIPTQIIIDLKGEIGFRNIGFDPQMEDKLTQMVEILAEESTGMR